MVLVHLHTTQGRGVHRMAGLWAAVQGLQDTVQARMQGRGRSQGEGSKAHAPQWQTSSFGPAGAVVRPRAFVCNTVQRCALKVKVRVRVMMSSG